MPPSIEPSATGGTSRRWQTDATRTCRHFRRTAPLVWPHDRIARRAGSVCLNSFGAVAKWISALVMPQPDWAVARAGHHRRRAVKRHAMLGLTHSPESGQRRSSTRCGRRECPLLGIFPSARRPRPRLRYIIYLAPCRPSFLLYRPRLLRRAGAAGRGSAFRDPTSATDWYGCCRDRPAG